MRKRIGLALGSGAARGLAHIGVLEVLEREGIPIDLIAGTSTGAVVGALYAHYQSAGKIRKLGLGLSWKKLAPTMDPSLPHSGLIKGRKLKNLIESFFGGDVDFRDLKIPFACVATDINTGQEIVIDEGPVPEALRASVSIPGIFAVVKRGGRYLADGLLVDPVPVSVVKNMGADFVIAVNVIPDVIEWAHRGHKGHRIGGGQPNIVTVIMHSLYIGTCSLVKTGMKDADVIIEPKMTQGFGDFGQALEMIEHGKLAAEESLPELRRKLGNIRETAVKQGGGHA